MNMNTKLKFPLKKFQAKLDGSNIIPNYVLFCYS